MGVETTKGHGHRPYDVQLKSLGEDIWREKDPDKKAALIQQWHELKWKEALDNNPHLKRGEK